MVVVVEVSEVLCADVVRGVALMVTEETDEEVVVVFVDEEEEEVGVCE